MSASKPTTNLGADIPQKGLLHSSEYQSYAKA